MSNKKHADWKRNKTITTANGKTLYIENSELHTHKLLELVNKFSKIAGYNINVQK